MEKLNPQLGIDKFNQLSDIEKLQILVAIGHMEFFEEFNGREMSKDEMDKVFDKLGPRLGVITAHYYAAVVTGLAPKP